MTTNDAQRLIVADIGGTNSRFALLEGSPLQLLTTHTVSTACASFAEVLEVLRREAPVFFEKASDCVVLAVAGAVTSQSEVKLTNASYAIYREELAPLSDHVLFINDFEAQAWSTVTAIARGVEPIEGLTHGLKLDAEALGKGVLVIGPGTGLGVAYCRLIDDQLMILPTEGGHVTLPVNLGVESDFAMWLREHLSRDVLEYEDCVCGPGLERIHAFITGAELSAPEITSAADFARSNTCAWFGRFLARACRNMALSTLPRGGILITGGVVGHCPDLVRCEAFRREFLRMRAPFDAVIHSIPVWLNRNQQSGLWGAAEAARQYLKKVS